MISRNKYSFFFHCLLAWPSLANARNIAVRNQSKFSSLAPFRVCNVPSMKTSENLLRVWRRCRPANKKASPVYPTDGGVSSADCSCQSVKKDEDRWPIVVLRRKDGLQGNRPQGHRTLPHRRFLHLPIRRAQPLVGQEHSDLHPEIR